MRIIKDGISRNIAHNEWGFYQQQGWRKVGCSEPQPSQEDLYIIDDYTIGRLDKKGNSTLLIY